MSFANHHKTFKVVLNWHPNFLFPSNQLLLAPHHHVSLFVMLVALILCNLRSTVQLVDSFHTSSMFDYFGHQVGGLHTTAGMFDYFIHVCPHLELQRSCLLTGHSTHSFFQWSLLFSSGPCLHNICMLIRKCVFSFVSLWKKISCNWAYIWDGESSLDVLIIFLTEALMCLRNSIVALAVRRRWTALISSLASPAWEL